MYFNKTARLSLKALALGALASSALTPAYAQQKPVTPGVNVITASKGVPVVNIATPNAQGVSYNTFSQFDVSAKGLILNNVSTDQRNTWAGYVRGNPNVKAKQATLIINEIVSPAASAINGRVDVLGKKAAVVIANPNGISCNNCSFTNASRVTFAAATPTIENGTLASLTTGAGGVRISGTPTGLTANTVNQLDVVGRTVVLEGKIWTKDLVISAGDHTFNYAKRTATVQDIFRNTDYAIQSLNTGYVVATNIRLISSGKGLGVNLVGKLTSNSYHTIIQSTGDVSLNRVESQMDLRVTTLVRFRSMVRYPLRAPLHLMHGMRLLIP